MNKFDNFISTTCSSQQIKTLFFFKTRNKKRGQKVQSYFLKNNQAFTQIFIGPLATNTQTWRTYQEQMDQKNVL